MKTAQARTEVPLTLHDVGRYLDSLGNAIAEDMSGAVNRALENEKCLEFTLQGDASLIAELRTEAAVWKQGHAVLCGTIETLKDDQTALIEALRKAGDALRAANLHDAADSSRYLLIRHGVAA